MDWGTRFQDKIVTMKSNACHVQQKQLTRYTQADSADTGYANFSTKYDRDVSTKELQGRLLADSIRVQHEVLEEANKHGQHLHATQYVVETTAKVQTVSFQGLQRRCSNNATSAQ
jgi:hypothetical protein